MDDTDTKHAIILHIEIESDCSRGKLNLVKLEKEQIWIMRTSFTLFRLFHTTMKIKLHKTVLR